MPSAASWFGSGLRSYLLSDNLILQYMFRVTKSPLQQGFDRLNGHVRGAYQDGRAFAGIIDHAVGVGRKAYHVLKPLLDQTATGKKLSGGLTQGLMTYDTLRGDVLSVHDKTHI